VIVLDTHVWVWWASDPAELSRKARALIDQAVTDRQLFLSSISAWEVALLACRGRLQLTMHVRDWIARSEALPFLSFVPVDNAIALRSVALPPPLHGDPADRVIVATAVSLGALLVTKDKRILKYRHARSAW
jgi:PIN domain nuclease of toxin-antitoxin system